MVELDEWLQVNFEVSMSGSKFALPKVDFPIYYGNRVEEIPTSGQYNIEIEFKEKEDSPWKNLDPPVNNSTKELSPIAEKMVNMDHFDTIRLKLYRNSTEWHVYWDSSRHNFRLGFMKKHGYSTWMKRFPSFLLNMIIPNNNLEPIQSFFVEYLIYLSTFIEDEITQTYESHVRKILRPFRDYIDAEFKSLRDKRFIPKSEFRKLGVNREDDNLFEIQLYDPPRVFEKDEIYVKIDISEEKPTRVAISKGYDDEDQIHLFPVEHVRSWPESGWLRISANTSSTRRKQDTINLLMESKTIYHQRLLDLISRPQSLPQIEWDSVVPIKEIFRRGNEESLAQCEAIDKASSTVDMCLIQGPPGTGKTEVICELILQVISRGGRVLFASPTNVAVDNVLERIHDSPGVLPIRIGRTRRVDPNLRKYLMGEQIKDWQSAVPILNNTKIEPKSEFDHLQADLYQDLHENDSTFVRSLILDQKNLVCGTTLGVVNTQFSQATIENPFDLLIIDEASKANLIEFLVPAVRAKKWVLVGDHRQLAPHVDDTQLKIYLQNFLEENHLVSNRNESKEYKRQPTNVYTRGYDKVNVIFDPKVDEIMKNIRRLHEEFHDIDQKENPYLNPILEIFNKSRNQSISFMEMIEYALGSCFHYFYKKLDNSRKTYLPFQHRMPLEIADILNKEIYHGRFSTSQSATEHGLAIELTADNFRQSVIQNPTFFISTSKCKKRGESKMGRGKGRIYNKLESKVVVRLLKNLTEKYPFNPLEGRNIDQSLQETRFRIGIITFYANQSRYISNLLKNDKDLIVDGEWTFHHRRSPVTIRVSNVDRFQGQEQEIIILSMVRSNNTSDSYRTLTGREKSRLNRRKNPGFLQNIQRLNVGLSRARHNMYIIGDLHFFRRLPDRPTNQFLRVLANYYFEQRWIIDYVEGDN